MKIQLGQITVNVDIDVPENTDVMEMKLSDIFKAGSIPIKNRDSDNSISAVTKEKFTKNLRKSDHSEEFSEEIASLHNVSITDKTIVSIVKKFFNKSINQTDLARHFGKFEASAAEYLNRHIEEDIWALYAAPVELRGERIKICLVGLNNQNQLNILAIEEGTPEDAFQRTIKRGLNPKKVTLGILSFHLNGMKEFKETFKRAVVQLDWNEYQEMSVGAETKLKLREAITSHTAKQMAKLLDSIEAPRELLTYLDYPEELRWAIRTTNPIKKLEKDINSKLRITERPHLKRVLDWAILRMQFQWSRMSMDSKQLSSLRFTNRYSEMVD